MRRLLTGSEFCWALWSGRRRHFLGSLYLESCSNISLPRALRAAEGSPPPLHAMSLHGDTNGEAWAQPEPGSGDTAGFRLGSSLSPVTGPWTSYVPLRASPLSLSAQWGHLIIYSLEAQLCLTLCSPMDCSPPGSSGHGILQARVLEWVAMTSSRGSSRLHPGLPSFRQMLYRLSHQGSPGMRLAPISRWSPNQPPALPCCVSSLPFPESSAPAPRLDRPSSTAPPKGPASLPALCSF